MHFQKLLYKESVDPVIQSSHIYKKVLIDLSFQCAKMINCFFKIQWNVLTFLLYSQEISELLS